MPQPERADTARTIAVSIRLDGRSPYAMFELVELTATIARLRSPLLLEVGEQVGLRLERAGKIVDVDGRIASIARGDGHGDPVTTVELADAAAVAPLLS